MTQEEREILKTWLAGPRDFTEGAMLYRRFGSNLMLKKTFSVDSSPAAREMLVNEIRKLAGLSEMDLAGLRRVAKNGEGLAVSDSIQSESKATSNLRSPLTPNPAPIPPEEEKKIRFREKYPFLASADCPEVLKILVADMFTAYGKVRESHDLLLRTPDGEHGPDVAKACETCVDEYLENRLIFDELTHYKEKGTLLGVHPKVKVSLGSENPDTDYATMDTAELVRKLNSALANVSKAKKKLAKANTEEKKAEAEDRLEKWQDRLEAIRAAIELRKKN